MDGQHRARRESHHAIGYAPEQRAAQIEALTKAYEPTREDLRSEIARNYDTLMGPSPQGQMAGNNAFSVYVGANPLEHLASGINKYQAGRDIRSQREELKNLSKEESAATSRVMQAQLADILRRKDEEEKRRQGYVSGWWNAY